MSDRVFIYIVDVLLGKGVTLVALPFTRKRCSGKGQRLNGSKTN